MSRRAWVCILVLALLLAAAVAARLLVGGSLQGLSESAARQIVAVRLTRTLGAALVGAALATGGVLLQSLLRNPLASPDLLGPSAGSSLAVVISVWAAATWGSGSGDAWAAWHAGPALAGSLGALALVYGLGQRRGLIDPGSLVLVGVMVSVMCGAAIMLLDHLMQRTGSGGRSVSTAGLLIGTIRDDVPAAHLWVIGAVVGVCVVLAAWAGRSMDAAMLGDDEAASVGLNLPRLRALQFVLAGLLTAGAVLLAGPVGFVGLLCPHAARLVLGPRAGDGSGGVHRPLVLAAALCGASLMIAADVLVRTIDTGAGRLPVGIVTALLGGPALIALVRSRGAAGGEGA